MLIAGAAVKGEIWRSVSRWCFLLEMLWLIPWPYIALSVLERLLLLLV